MSYYLRVFGADGESVFPAKLLRKQRWEHETPPRRFIDVKHMTRYVRLPSGQPDTSLNILAYGAEVVDKKTGESVHRVMFQSPRIIQPGWRLRICNIYRTPEIAHEYRCTTPLYPAS